MKTCHYLLLMGILALVIAPACETDYNDPQEHPVIDRHSKLPNDILKQWPETDQYPPILYSDEFVTPVPMPTTVNTSGGEDSPFITPDGNTLYFFFTPDVRIPVESQILDSLTGVWVSHKVNNQWTEAERLWLQDPGKLSMDGAIAIQDDEMWFASAREGFTGVNIFTARLVNGEWTDVSYAGDRLMKEIKVGELHLHDNDLYFHSEREGGMGSYDIWKTTRSGESWSDPININEVNTGEMDGWPFVSFDGTELWFTRVYLGTPAIFRSVKTGDRWSAPEMIVSQFAGEPTLDKEGNLYFVHHFYRDGVMIEADIYTAGKSGE